MRSVAFAVSATRLGLKRLAALRYLRDAASRVPDRLAMTPLLAFLDALLASDEAP